MLNDGYVVIIEWLSRLNPRFWSDYCCWIARRMQIKPTFFGLFPLFRPPLLARQGDPPSPQRRGPGWLLRQQPGKRLLPKRRKQSPSGTIHFNDFMILVLRAHNNSLTPTVCTVWHIFTLSCQHPTTAKPGPRSNKLKRTKVRPSSLTYHKYWDIRHQFNFKATLTKIGHAHILRYYTYSNF